MSFKLALLLLFGFVALAVAVPLEDTEEKTMPADPVEADAEKPENPLEETDADENEDEDLEDADEEPEADDNEDDEPENQLEAKEEDGNDKRGYRPIKCRRFRLRRSCRRNFVRCYPRRLGCKGRKQTCFFCRKYNRYSIMRICRRCSRRCPRGRRYYRRPRLACRRVCKRGRCRIRCSCSCLRYYYRG